MKLLDWIKANRPGNVSEYYDRVEIEHQSGEHSIGHCQLNYCEEA